VIFPDVKTVLLDRRNIATELPLALAAIASTPFNGLDCETQDTARHEGLRLYCKYKDDESKAKNTKLVFDNRRTVMTGFSIWPENHDTAWYINLAHADEDNRVTFDEVCQLLDALPAEGLWISHNAPFELVMFQNAVGYILPEGRVICSMQMAVSAYGPDEYNRDAWLASGLGTMRVKLEPLINACRRWTPRDPGDKNYPTELAELIGSIIGKETKSDASYNGFVKSIAYGYGLKQAVKSWFGHTMTTFEEVLDDNKHMGQLTGDEVVAYGAEDAIWCVRLFRHLLGYMATNCPDAIHTFFTQENPMIHIFAAIWQQGIRINLGAVDERRTLERLEYVNLITQLKVLLREIPWRPELDATLAGEEDWYVKNGMKYRQRLDAWTSTETDSDPFTEAVKIAGAVPNGWADQLKIELPKNRLNIGHYMPMRVIYYDLLQQKVIKAQGKVQSDGDARGKLIVRAEKVGDERAIKILKLMGDITSVEQRMKLYLTPYMLLTDPETQRLYPVVNSMLATRRMAASYPNTMQLAKHGDSTYVRGFYLGDTKDHLIMSADWSGVELVAIGEASGDPAFLKAYAQLPHADLHAGAAADVLSIELPEMNEEIFKALKGIQTVDEVPEWARERLLVDLDGRALAPAKVYSYWRTECGKAANFNYWYSGFLTTIGERMGWSMQTTGEASQRYAARFAVAEEWRKAVIEEGAFSGITQIADGHRRVRPEARLRFLDEWQNKWPIGEQTFNNVIRDMGRRLNRRAGNVLVNAKIQGLCGGLAKRSAIAMKARFKKEGIDDRICRFMWPTHDELTYSTRWDMVADIAPIVREVMCDHPDLFSKCKLDATVSVGRTFEPWNPVKAPFGQVELMEPPKELVGANDAGHPLDHKGVTAMAQYLHEAA
jgi:DNA polymerase I-like protein with 3'-5' exonuclease and polymerase domains